jgi:hypothetical protein
VPSLHTETEQNSSKFVPEFPALMYRSAPRFLCLLLVYDCLKICANCYSSKLSIKCCTIALENVPKPPRKYHINFPRFLCKKTSRTTVRNPYSTDCSLSCTFCLDFRASFLLYGTRKSIQYDLFSELYSTSIFVPSFNVNPYSTTCNKCCTFCLEMHASFQPWNACPSSAKMASFSNSNFFSCSLKKCFNNPRMGAPSYPSRPHEGISRVISSNG